MKTLHRPAPALAAAGDPVVLTPADAEWRYCGLRVLRLPPGGCRTIVTGDAEHAVLPLSGAVRVEVDGCRFDLAGRASVFAAVTDWAYLPVDAEVRLSSAGGCEVALPSARARRRFPPAHVAAAEVPVEVRGAGPATRQVNNFMAPEVFAGADRLMAVEVLTPDGNWSSYPPHKHDGTDGCPANPGAGGAPVMNEEIYYFRVGRVGSTAYSPEGFALHRTYTGDGDIDETVAVADGDVFLIPRGYHGPCIAAPGYPLYYLNVLAGPAEERTMAFCDDPTHHWVRSGWEAMPSDPRCPMTGAGDNRS